MTASEFLRRLAEVLSRDPGSGESGADLVAASAEPVAPEAAVDTSWTPRPEEESSEPERPAEADGQEIDVSSHIPEGDEPGGSSLREPPRDEGAGVNVVTGGRMPEMPEGGWWTPMGDPWIR